jgi:hypothetical protein
VVMISSQGEADYISPSMSLMLLHQNLHSAGQLVHTIIGIVKEWALSSRWPISGPPVKAIGETSWGACEPAMPDDGDSPARP